MTCPRLEPSSTKGAARHRRAGEEPCAECRGAAADYHRAWDERTGRVRRPRALGPRHGTPSTYNTGCRCDDCRQANADAKRFYRARRRLERAGHSGHQPDG